MSYEIEDEIDWSDSPLGPPSPENPNPPVVPKHHVEHQEEKPGVDRISTSTTEHLYELPQGSPLLFTYECGDRDSAIPSRAQRARVGVHQNRRKLTKDDYMNFALYQANQKAYEATFLKRFVAHALHPDRIAACSTATSESGVNIAEYLRSVIHNVNGLTDKMIWNAHCRAVNLLANDGMDEAPFLDVHQIPRGILEEYGPQNLISVVGKMNESWHRATSEPVMVRMSIKQYPISFNSSPLEEIDEITERVFKDLALSSTLPTGRATQPLARKRGKGRGKSRAVLREQPPSRAQGHWLVLPQSEKPHRSPTPPPILLARQNSVADPAMGGDDPESRMVKDAHHMQPPNHNLNESIQSTEGGAGEVANGSTRLEDLYCRYGAAALDSDRDGSPTHSDDADIVAKVPSWPLRLIRDHKRRLAERWEYPSQTLRTVLPGIKQVIAEALALGYQPNGEDYQRKIKIIQRQEQRRQDEFRTSSAQDPEPHGRPSDVLPPSRVHTARYAPERGVGTKKQSRDTPRKRQKTTESPTKKKKEKHSSKKEKALIRKHIKTASSKKVSVPEAKISYTSHPSGSKTLANHQILPPDAYFEPQNPDDKPAWRCGINHAMGHYYNAGNRTACTGCFTNIKYSLKTTHMDFYLPRSTSFFQPAPDIIWTPSKPREKTRRSKHLSHNSIAKIAYWKAIGAGKTPEEARRAGVEAVKVVMRRREPKEPTPEPTPEPEPDLGPHPSGSATMEHGQDLPECAYFEQVDEDEEHAWRCDINHALGRYYLAGDKRTCPGCGINKNTPGKHLAMDFYMPPGTVVRQEAPELCRWVPRKPYKPRKSRPGAVAKKTYLTHNQACSKKYFEAIEAGHDREEAIKIAIDGMEAELEVKEAELLARQEETDDSDQAEQEEIQDSSSVNETSSHSSEDVAKRHDSTNTSNDGDLSDDNYRSNVRGGFTVSLVPRKRASEEMSDDDDDDVEVNDTSDGQQGEDKDQEEVSISSSDDEETSESDSE